MTEEQQTEKQTEQNMLMEFIHDDCIIDIEKKIEYPPVALSCGEKLIQTKERDLLIPIAIGTYGNLSVITAPPKTRKTFFVSLLASAYLSNNNIYTGKIKGHKEDGNLLHIDTEQGRYHASRVFLRPYDMDNNIEKNKYHHFSLRTVDYKERLQFIEWFLKERIKKKSLVIIDGVADLCADVNNIEQTNKLVSSLMRISTQYNAHIINVIHQNFGSAKLGTGHLGSALEKKAETVIALEANTVNKDWTTVKCGRSRGYCFDTFSFEVNDYGLPQVVKNLYDPLA
jgi:RecA-family ATPase